MEFIGRYILIQWKRCLKRALRSLLIIALASAFFFITFFGIMKVYERKEISIVKLGIAFPEEETLSRYVMDFIGNMSSVKSIASFEIINDEDKAKDEFKEGSLDAVVILPKGFYHDVQVGINPPAVIYLNNSDRLSVKIFKELLISGVSFLQTAESSVYAAIDTAYGHGSVMEISDIGNEIALRYVNEISARNKMFKEDTLSPFGDIEEGQYFKSAAFLMIMMFIGVIFSFLYTKSDDSVRKVLRINGLNSLIYMLAKSVVMFPFVFIPGIIFFGLNIEIFLVSLMLTVYFEVIYGITKDGKKGIFVLIIFNIIGSVCAGLFIPSSFMAPWVNALGRIAPQRLWITMLGGRALW